MTSDSPTTSQWDFLQAQLNELSESLQEERELSPAEKLALLEQRAQELARSTDAHFELTSQQDALKFQLAGEQFLLSVEFIREVIPATDLVKVPGSPDILRGLINLRGEIVAVMNLDLFFREQVIERKTTRILILGKEQVEFGVLVDSVSEIETITDSLVVSAPKSLSDQATLFVQGVTTDARLILDGEALLSAPVFHIEQDDTT